MDTWNAKYRNKWNEFEVKFCSDDYEKAKAVERVCQYIMDGEITSRSDVAPVRRGKWNWVHRLRGGFKHYTGREANPGTEYPETYTIIRDDRIELDDPYCPFCGKLNESVWLNFCPNCGADMREVPNDD